jgi:ABC-2 type transport system ATP-binding protein
LTAISVQNLRKQYAGMDRLALDIGGLEVRAGEMVALLGPNGAGKTTLISILCGLTPATGGAVSLLGLPGGPSSEAVRARIGLIPQTNAVYEELSARENLALFGRLYGMAGAALRDRVDGLLRQTGLCHAADRPVGTYSGGMKRLVNMMAGLVHRPELVFLDEPDAGIDTEARQRIFAFVRELHGAGATIVYTTHYVDHAEQLCSRVVVLARGKVVADETMGDLMARQPVKQRLESIYLDIVAKAGAGEGQA